MCSVFYYLINAFQCLSITRVRGGRSGILEVQGTKLRHKYCTGRLELCSVVRGRPVVQVQVARSRHQLLVEPLLHHGVLQPLLLSQEGVCHPARQGDVAMVATLGEGTEVVEEVLQLVHLGLRQYTLGELAYKSGKWQIDT